MPGIPFRRPLLHPAPAAQSDDTDWAAGRRGKWRWFLALGVVLALCGAAAIAVPEISTFAASVVLGIALALAGIVKMIQSLQVREWGGFVWQELTGAAEVVGGILIYFNPLKGAFAITLLIAAVFLVHGLLQIALAVRIREQKGAYWFALSGLVALVASAALALKLPFTSELMPGIIAGISLMVAGGAYVAIALTMRRAPQ